MSSSANPTAPSPFFQAQILAVRHWTDRLFSLTTQREPSFRFRSGQFVMLGLQVDGRPLLRAYSVASAAYEDTLEFFSIKAPNGPLTSRLQHAQPGDTVLLGRKATGTLVLDNLRPGKRLYLISTGTGIAPFLSLIKDPETYAMFDRVILTHTCRKAEELAYRHEITTVLGEDELVGEDVRAKLTYYPTVTQEDFEVRGRITDLIRVGQFHRDIDTPSLDPTEDRVLVCGGAPLLTDLAEMLEAAGFEEASHAEPGDYAIEKAFVER